MVHTTCAVDGCLSSSRLSKQLKFHQFPHTEERCKHWIDACGRPDLTGKPSDTLKNMYVCSLHFEKKMYGKKSLKKIASPTLRLPAKKTVPTTSIHTQTERGEKHTTVREAPKKHNTSKPDKTTTTNKQQQKKQKNELDPTTLLEIDIGASGSGSEDDSESEAEPTPQKRKLRNQLPTRNKVMRLSSQNHEVEIVTKEQFLKACDMYLSPNLSSIVKADLYLKAERERVTNSNVSNYFV